MITSEELIKIVSVMNKTTCSSDPFPSKLLMSHLPTIIDTIMHIINLCLSTSVFPASFKSAVVLPLIEKPGLDPQLFKNYRPVSNLSFLSKLIEKVISSRILKHIADNKLIDKFQSAYRCGHSTETALLRVYNDIVTMVGKGNGSYLVLLDLSAAFDTIDHDTLFVILEKYVGITGSALQLLKLTIPVHDFPFRHLSDDCLIDELNPEINAVNEININNPPDFIIDSDHIDYSVLGSIDPDTNFLLGNDSSLCHYFTEYEFNQCFPSDDKFSLFNLNIRSLPKNIEKVQHFLDGLHYKFTIITFTETWLAEYNSSLHNFIGYSHVYKLRDKKRRGGGVSMFIDSRILYQDRNDINIDIEYVDTLAIEIPKEELNTNHNTVIISIYRPPSIQQNLFTEKLGDLLNYLSRENKLIYILGDFNIDTSNAIISPNIGVNDFQNTFLSYFYTPLIDKFTRVSKITETATLLDIIYTNVTPNANSIKSGVFKTDISDHYSIFCITDFVTMGSRKKESRTKRDFSQKNISNFSKSLKKIDWNHLISENFQTSFSSFYRKFCDIFENNFPERTIIIGYMNRLPYLTKALRKSIEHKHIPNHILKKIQQKQINGNARFLIIS